MKVKIVFALIIIIFATILTACIDFSLPIYEKTDEDGVSVIIDGVRYKQLPMLKWDVSTLPIWEAKKIGYAGGRDIELTEVYGDIERNFIDVWMNGYYECFLYRTDIVIPEPTAEVIDKIIWGDVVVGNIEGYCNTIVDKNIIEELFNILNTDEKFRKYEMVEKNSEIINISISCYSSDLTGAHYDLDIGTSSGGKIICGNKRENEYVEISIELLEKIAGKSLRSIFK